MASKIPSKSARCIGNNPFNACFLPFTVSAKIISRMALILSTSKNICSVLVKPIPWAPNPLAILASLGVSALVLTCIMAYLSANFIISANSPVNVGSTVATLPSIIFPVEPFKEIQSPS